ncbi:MAG TPA: Tol-Pal system beta propeller repeat protein TolB [Rhodocyclaceae bacterium]|nr:Tol-Pal system beta propeller repeat protein TolB [Rhodocyclaceae bacterium]
MKRRHFLSLCSGVALSPLLARAQLTIEISGAGNNRIPIAIGAFDGETALPQKVSDVIRADLERCGLFRLVDASNLPPASNAPPDWASWKTRGADALVTGAATRLSDGRFDVSYRLYDVVKQAGPTGSIYTIVPDSARRAAHIIANAIYEKLIGEPGAFATRIAYIRKTGSQYALMVADADGYNPVTALRSPEPLISPAWSPDGTRIAYVSFFAKKPILHVFELATGRISVLANFKGSNSAPAWAPDGRKLAIVLTKDGSSQLYQINADGSGVRRLTTSSGIDTEPGFSTDGRWLYFTSDRGGGPQIYRIPADGNGDAQRMTFEGDYNVSSRISPDNKTLAYISRNNGRFQLTVMDMASQQTQVLTDTAKDESPSFAPNGRLILYATEVGEQGVLSVVSIDGATKYRLSQQASDVREPAWGPLVR